MLDSTDSEIIFKSILVLNQTDRWLHKINVDYMFITANHWDEIIHWCNENLGQRDIDWKVFVRLLIGYCFIFKTSDMKTQFILRWS